MGPGPRPLGGPKYPIFTLRRALWALAPGPWEGPNTLYLPLEGPPQLARALGQGPGSLDPGPWLGPWIRDKHPQQLLSSCWGCMDE